MGYELKQLKDDFFKDLQEKKDSYIVSKWILDKIPYIFKDDLEQYINWKELLSNKIKVDSRAICITGSANCGFSLNPQKNYRKFNDESDIDVAIISTHYFDISWHYLRNMGSERYNLLPKQKASITDHVNRLIYWGTIATDKILPILPFGIEWSKALIDMSKENRTSGREIKVRIYKDYESLRAYHINNITKLRNKYLMRTIKQEELK